MYCVLVFLSLQVLVGSMWIQPTVGQTPRPSDSAVPEYTPSSPGARGTAAPETSTQVSSTNGSCTENAFEGDFSDKIGEDGKPRTWCEERGGTCSNNECKTAFYKDDDMGCAAKHKPGFMCCKSLAASDIQCTSLENFRWLYFCEDMTVCENKGGYVLRARRMCGGKPCRRCCRKDPWVPDVEPGRTTADGLTDDTGMASLSNEKFTTEGSATTKPTGCRDRGGTCSKKCPTAFYKDDDMGCGAKHGPGFMCCKSWEAADIECTWHTDLRWEYVCKDMTVCEEEGGKVLHARGLCGGKPCRRCCRKKAFIGDFEPLGNCFNDAEIKQLYITLRRFEDLKQIAYDAKPECEEVDWTICIGFKLHRTDAKQVFAKVLPGVKIKDVVDQKKKLTVEQCEALLKHDMINIYIPRAKLVAGDKCAEFPTNVKIALVSAVYRGDLRYSHKTAALIRAGDWCKVRAEYLDHEGYRTCKARGLPGIATRMEWNAAQFQSMCNQ